MVKLLSYLILLSMLLLTQAAIFDLPGIPIEKNLLERTRKSIAIYQDYLDRFQVFGDVDYMVMYEAAKNVKINLQKIGQYLTSYNNVIIGNNNVVKGVQNVVLGNQNTVKGNRNWVLSRNFQGKNISDSLIINRWITDLSKIDFIKKNPYQCLRKLLISRFYCK